MDEVLAVLFAVVIGLIYFPKVSNAVATQAHTMRDVTTAQQQQQWVSAVTNYVNANLQGLQSSVGGSPAVITNNVMGTSGLGLPTGFTGTNPFNQTWQAAISQPTAGNLQVLVYTTGGTVIQDQELGLIARAANGVGGFIPSNNSGIYAGGYQNAYGAFGAWKVATSGYPVGTSGGSPATLINFNNGSLQSNYLYRNAIPGQPQLAEMNTTLTMNTNQDIVLKGGALMAASGVGATVGNSQFYGDGSNTAIGQNGTLKVMNQALSAYGALESGTVTTTGVISAGGDINGSGNLNISGDGKVGGNLQVLGSTNSNGNVSSGGYLISNQNASLGTECRPNGAMANSGSGPLFCQSDVWVQLTPPWTWIPQTEIAAFPVNGPASTLSFSVAGVVPATAKVVNVSVEAIDGDSTDGTGECSLGTGGCLPVESAIYGFDAAGNLDQFFFLNQQKSGTGIWSGAEYSGSLPIAGGMIFINKGAAIPNVSGGGMNAQIYINGYY